MNTARVRRAALVALVISTLALASRAAEAPMTQPSPEQRRQILDELRLVFRPFVFSGERFPACDLEQARLAKLALGEYRLSTDFYDEQHQPAQRARQPGRYGAITTITLVDGTSIRRFSTLYRLPGQQRIDWDEFQADFATALPEELGIDPAVAREQSRILSSFLGALMGESMARSSASAILLAGLRESRTGAGPLPRRFSPAELDRRWWYELKRKLGLPASYQYITMLPDGYEAKAEERFPLLLFLHGAGERGEDLGRLGVHGPHKAIAQSGAPMPFVLVAPQCPAGEWWFAEQVNTLLDEVVARYRVDPDRIYLTGLSMGGYGTWDLAIAHPDRFAAIVPICGGGDPAEAGRIAHIPIWVVHGEKDTLVLPERSYEMIEALSRLGGRVRYTLYPEAGHDSWTATYRNPELYTWLLAQRRSQPAQAKATTQPVFPR